MRFWVLAGFLTGLLTGGASAAYSQELTLDQAIALAKKNNGVLVAAQKSVAIAQSNVREAAALFFPFITPSYQYTDVEDKLTSHSPVTRDSVHELGVGATWQVLDGGQRWYGLNQSRKLFDSTRYSSLWTMRQTLFAVTQSFYDALRAQELLKSADAELVRTKQILEVVKARAAVGDIAKKDILQAEADVANAEVAQITASNDVDSTQAALKAVIGWPAQNPLPALAKSEPTGEPSVTTLDDALSAGQKRRPDLLSTLRALEAERFGVLTAQREASLDWSLNVNFNKDFEPENSYNRTLTFVVSFPLFDAGFSRERARQAQLSLESNRALYQQDVRNARSEIEATFLIWKQNKARLDAADRALKAAQINYDAASESQRLGAASIQEVTTARTTLITAEVNYIQAVYDSYISDVQYRLVIGDPLPGENS